VTNKTVTLIGTGFSNGVALATTIGGHAGVTVSSTTFVDGTHLSLGVSVSSSAPVASDYTVNLTNGDGRTATKANAFAVDPTASGPTIGSLSPSSLTQGDTNKTVTLTGTGFQNGGPLAASITGHAGVTVSSTTFIDATHLSLQVSVSSTAAAASDYAVGLTNGDGSTANKANAFTVTTTTTGPTIDSLNPPGLAQGVSHRRLTLTGTSFKDGTSLAASITGHDGVTVNSTKFVDSTRLDLHISVSSSAMVATDYSVDLTNGNGRTVKKANGFSVDVTPTVGAASPPAVAQGVTDTSIALIGTGFSRGATAQIEGTGVTVVSVKFVSSTKLTAVVAVARDAATGTRQVNVINLDGGIGACTGCFTTSAAPTIAFPTSSDRRVVHRGRTTWVRIIGTGFHRGVDVRVSHGFKVDAIRFIDSSRIRVKVTAKDRTAKRHTGRYDLVVTNPDGGKTRSVNSMVNRRSRDRRRRG
jgi:hypothetical protein